ncbi:MAG: arginine--tRNA ligase, partial [Chromatiales bacterium]|nr:arginine--tRNA ligase [Chromatiales bacterium]
MKTKLQALLDAAVETLRRDGVLPPDLVVDTQLTRTRDKTHGDFASNVAMQLAKPARRSPRDIAQAIVERIGTDDVVAKCEIAGPGFINFFLSADARLAVVPLVLKTGSDYGRSHFGRGRRVQVEFVSANPTGPLHVGHGRGAAYGAAVADLLEAVGFDV